MFSDNKPDLCKIHSRLQQSMRYSACNFRRLPFNDSNLILSLVSTNDAKIPGGEEACVGWQRRHCEGNEQSQSVEETHVAALQRSVYSNNRTQMFPLYCTLDGQQFKCSRPGPSLLSRLS